MVRSLVGALLGAVVLGLVPCIAGLLLGWLEFDGSLLVAGAIGAVLGAVLGWLRPGLFLKTVLFFLEPSVFD